MCSVELKNIEARFASRGNYIYDKLNLFIPPNSITGIYGPNAVGKTTLLRILGGITKNIKLKKTSIITYGLNERKPFIAMAPQDYAATLLPWYTIKKNLLLPLLARNKYTVTEATEKVENLCAHFNFKPDSDLVYELSGGQKQMLVLLRCLVVKPDLLLLDEPFSALDIYKGHILRDRFLEYLETEKFTTILISHNLEEVVYFSDMILFLNKNKGVTSIKGIEAIEIPRPRKSIDIYNELIMKRVRDCRNIYVYN